MTILKKILFTLRKYKSLVILGLLLLLLVFFNRYKILEGLTNNSIGEYDFLAPLPPDNNFDDAVLKKFMDKYNANVNEYNKTAAGKVGTFDLGNKNLIDDYKKNVTQEELQYYIDNNEFPYDGYITKYVQADPKNYPQGLKTGFLPFFPNRYVYLFTSYQKDKSSNPQPLAYKIVTGEEKPPTSLPTLPTTATTSLPTSATTATTSSPTSATTSSPAATTSDSSTKTGENNNSNSSNDLPNKLINLLIKKLS